MINRLPAEDKQRNLLYPLLLASHVSPGFLTGYLGAYILAAPHLSPLLFLTVYGGNILAALLFLRPAAHAASGSTLITEQAHRIHASYAPHPVPTPAPKPYRSFSVLFSETIQSSVLSIVTVGVNVMLFSVATALCSTIFGFLAICLPTAKPALSGITLLISGLLEVTSGCDTLVTMNVPLLPRLSLVTLFASFGGLSGIFQIRSILKAPFPLGRFIKIKISTALLSAGTMLILQILFSIK